MSLGFRSASGLTNTQISQGMSVAQIPGDGGAGPLGFTIIISASGVTPGTGAVNISAPSTFVASGGPADSDGNMSAQVTWFNTGNDKDFVEALGGAGSFPDGFWGTAQLIRGSVSPGDVPIGIDIQFSTDAVLGFTTDLNNFPDAPSPQTPQWDGQQGQVTLDIHYEDGTAEHPDSIAIVRDGTVVAAIPVQDGISDYQFTDMVFEAGTYDYELIVYKYPDSRSILSGSASVVFGGVPTVTIVGDLTISFGLAAEFVFITDPSGLYVLTTDQFHDSLYDRISGSSTTDVAIPEPFWETAFLGE